MVDTATSAGKLHRTHANILELVEKYHVGWLKRYRKREVLYWQGDRAECVFVVKKGAVKLSAISWEGKTHTYDVLGAGRLVGATVALAGGEHESTAEALRDTEVYVIPLAEFERLLVSDSLFAMAVIQELAETVRLLANKVRDLSLMDVQQRLKHGLTRLAEEHGVASGEGVMIDLGITHQEIAEMIAANRSTVTSYLSVLEQEGIVWKEGRRLFLIPPEHAEILDHLKRAVIEGDAEAAASWAQKVVEEGVDPIKALHTLIGAMKEVDRGFRREELAIPDVIMAAMAMKRAMSIIKEEMVAAGTTVPSLGTVVIGTVRGDIHDIGKSIVSTLLTVAGFEVIDLGVDVKAWQFVEAVEEHKPDILAMSTFLSTTVSEQEQVVDVLREEGLRDTVKIMVGGGAMNPQLARRMGANGYEPTADRAVELAKKLVGAE